MHGCHYGYARAEHESDARSDKEERSHDIDCRKRVAACTMPYKSAVRHIDSRRKEHAQQSGEEHFTKQHRDIHRPEINTVSLHML